ncbi:MAG: GGDEF domain-containing protein [Candidatus Sumerlaeota bacterium]|nr:GGDEF domain-containing protein [Candidatus Sumerlaeota bacterium]
MADKSFTPNETVGIEDLQELDAGPRVSTRKNVPIIMLLQGENVGRKYLLQKREIIIGRAPEADIRLFDFEISRRHSSIVYENIQRPEEAPHCVVSDLNSKNGTLVNGVKVESQPLRDKDIVTVGSTVLGFYLKDEVEVKFDAELYSMATVDSLTGVHNKFYFQREFQRELKRAERGSNPLALVFCDLDHFKRVNDTYGHLAGDFILRKLGEILLSSMREYDICARYGGEEFAVALPGTSLEGALAVAERLRARVAERPFDYQGHAIPITISIGVAVLDGTMDSAEALLHAADKALYEAKSLGRNRVCVYSPSPEFGESL